ncbi:MAG: PGF-pre-PGF domain-containing protein [Candidatus Methanoperedens sp.]|nr:PGF-pre-PGF domain-containing protein [Candidatus Methanoperedens sp.]
MIRKIIYSSMILLVLIAAADATSSLTIGTPAYSSSVLKDESFTVEVPVEAASVSSPITVTITLTDNTNGVTITSAIQTKTYSSAGTQNVQWSVKANNPGTYSNPFTITAAANDGGQASPKTSSTSLSIKDRPVLTANVSQNATSVSPDGYVKLEFTIANVALPEAASATNINASLTTIPEGWTVITPANYTIGSLSSGGSQTSGYFIVKASVTAANYNLNMTITSAQGDSLSKGWTVTVASSSSGNGGGGSGGGGGGGGGGPSGENYSNILLRENYDLHIFKDEVTSSVFKNSSNPIKYVNITGNINAGDINTMVEVLKTPSSLVKEPVPGIVYRNVNIWVGTTGFALANNIREAVIVFTVENSWLANNNQASGDVRMVRWDKTQWIQLETREKSRNSDYTYFEAKTYSFSPFAITVIKGEIVPTAASPVEASTKTAMPEGTEASSTSTTRKTPGFEVVLAAAAGILAIWKLKK